MAGPNDKPGLPTDPLDWSGLVEACPGLLGEGLALRPAGRFVRGPLPAGRPDYVFYRREETGPGGAFGWIEFHRPEGAGAGVYGTGRARGQLAAIARGGFLNTDDFVAAGAGDRALVVVGTSGTVTRQCREALAAWRADTVLPGPLAPWTAREFAAIWEGQASPTVYVASAWRAGPGAHGDPAARAFAAEFEFLRVLLAAYGGEVSLAEPGTPEASRRLAVRLHEAACRCADAQASLTVAAALAPDRGAWQEALGRYVRIVERLAELPARLLAPPAQAEEALAQAAGELAGLLAQAERAARTLPG